MKLAMIGLGAIAPYFLSAIDRDPTLTLAAVCDLDETKLASRRQEGVAVFTDYCELLDSGLVDGVVITLPNDMHAEVACAALDRGVAVCCEKPMAITVEDASRIVAAATQSETVLFTAFHRRYNQNLLDFAARLPDHSRIVRVVHRYHENIEEHTGGDAWYLDLARCGGGCVIDNGPNALDAVRYLLGDLQLVDATIGDVRSGAEFYAELDLRSADGIAVRVELDWALPTGEVKDIEVHLQDGTVLSTDLLAGYSEFKSSLEHEYGGILNAFREAVAEGRTYRDPGPDLVTLVADAYRVAKTKETRLRMVDKEDCVAAMVKLLFHTRDDRGMELSEWGSRCVAAGEIHELVTTTDKPVREGDHVNNVGFLGFAEFLQATVLECGDEVWLGSDRRIGKIVGFDECHFPNHYNVLIKVPTLVAAADLNLRTGDSIHIRRGSQ